MGRLYTLLLFVLASSVCVAQNDAGFYLGLIGEQYQKISHEMMSYTSAVNHGKSARKVEKRRTDLLQQIKLSETTVRRMKPFNGSSALRDSIAVYLRLTTIVLNEDYGKIVNLEDIAEQSYDAMEAYLLAKEKASDKLDAAGDIAGKQYEAFASDNNIKLIKSDSELSNKMNKTSKVTQYANQAYLLFFKSYKNEAYLLDAMSRNDLAAVEQSRNALTSSAEADLAKLPTLGSFNGDATLRTSIQSTLNFYKLEAAKLNAFSDYLVSKDNFEKISKSFEAIPASKRTKQNVDDYNKAVSDFNAKVNNSNALNQEFNKKRNVALKAFNESYETFLDKHTPKYK